MKHNDNNNIETKTSLDNFDKEIEQLQDITYPAIMG